MRDSILVVGCGSIGQRHLRNLRALGFESLLAFDPLGERREQAARETGAQIVETLEAGLALHPMVALICTPPHLHLAAAQQALDAGAHLFIEKPIAHALDGVDALLARAAGAGRMIVVGYNWRFHMGLRKLKELLDAGTIGQPMTLRAEVGQYLPDWRPTQDYRTGYNVRAEMGGGIILDASHELDYVRWFGGEVETVYCAAGHLSNLEMDTEDAAAIILRLSGGIIAEIHLDCVQRGYARNCKIVGEQGTLTWDYGVGVRRFSGETKEWQEFPGAPNPNEMYLEEMRHLLACLRGETQPLVDGKTGRRVLEIALAARESARLQQQVRLNRRCDLCA